MSKANTTISFAAEMEAAAAVAAPDEQAMLQKVKAEMEGGGYITTDLVSVAATRRGYIGGGGGRIDYQEEAAQADPEAAAKALASAVMAIRAAGAPASGVPGIPALPARTTSDNAALYDELEMQSCLKDVNSSKKAVHNPLAALKARCDAGRQLSLALVNLGRICGMSPALWCLRFISPIRKNGPKTVTALKCLRPVSQASDMSAIQDSLWLLRCKGFIENSTGLAQMGGKFDCLAVIVAIVLHAEIRKCQGLLAYLLFANMQAAFDIANRDLMLYTCYLAGVTGME